MEVRVLYFASVREVLGHGETVSTDAATLGDLRSELIARGGAHAQALGRQRPLRMALDQVLGDEAAALRPGAEVAFFPPVTGG
jgi:molybdopterin synthase sulfur carrier subunit